jgi:hypothetical protein
MTLWKREALVMKDLHLLRAAHGARAEGVSNMVVIFHALLVPEERVTTNNSLLVS